MKVVKTQVVLFMHEKLLLEGELCSKEVKGKFELVEKILMSAVAQIPIIVTLQDIL